MKEFNVIFLGYRIVLTVMNHKYDVIITGAGAAGLMCAIEAGKRGRSVLVLEHNDCVGEKIRISGGGRCNFTNTHTSTDDYLCANPPFIKSALSRFTPEDFCRIIKKHNIPFHEKKLGQLFCDHSAQHIIDLLKKECALAGVEIRLKTRITHIVKTDYFILTTAQQRYHATSLVMATGGLSIPSLGASDFGYRIARSI